MDTPAIVNESYIERIVEQQIIEEQFPNFPDVYEKNKFNTKFKIIEYIPEKKNSKKTIFSCLLKNYSDNKIKVPCKIFKKDCKYNLKIISPLGNKTHDISHEVASEETPDSSERKQSLTFSFFDDNTGTSLDRILEVDDMGHTWGLKITYETDLEKNHLTIDYLTNLYTRQRTDLPVGSTGDGHLIIPQDFVDEIMLMATIDNREQSSNLLYHDYSFGFLSLDSHDDNFLLTASAQQKFFHNLMNLNIPDNQEDKSASQFGMVFGFHEGLYLPLRIRDWLNLSMDLKIGGRLSTISNASYLDFVASTDLTFGKSFMANLNFGYNTMLHDKGLRTILSFGPSLGTENFQFGINVLKPFGDAFQMYKFDDKNKDDFDLIIEYRFKFGF